MYATCIDTCSTLIYINCIHIQVRGGGGGGGGPDPPDPPPPCVRPRNATPLLQLELLCVGETGAGCHTGWLSQILYLCKKGS